MPETFLDMSGSGTARQIQGSLIAYMNLFVGLPNMVVVDSDVFWFVSNKPAPGNTILRTDWSADEAERRIDATFEQIGQHIDEISWWVFPGDQPADMNERLEARGIPSGRGGNWLWADLTQFVPEPKVSDEFHIKQVLDDQMMSDWVKISEEGFGNNDLGCFYDAYARHGYGADAFSLHYIGYLGDTPVTSGTLLDAGGSATLYDISTPPAFRQQGFGGALTHFMMKEICNRGYKDTWIWSSDMAKSTYRRLGYVEADFGLREHQWHK
jgi:GNAT superfamily N-acetyltransferase